MTSPATSTTQAPQAPAQEKPVKKKVKVYMDGKEVEYQVKKPTIEECKATLNLYRRILEEQNKMSKISS